MATCGIGRGQIGGMTTAAAATGNGDARGGEETATTDQRGRGRVAIVFRRGGRGGRGGRGRGTTIEGKENEEKKE